MKAVIFNLGCKVNQYESDALAQELCQRGYEVSSELEYADIYVINTCAVTAEAERKSRQAITRCLKHNPKAKVFVWGCAGEYHPEKFQKPQVAYIWGAKDKSRIINIIDKENNPLSDKPHENSHSSFRTRAYVKVQDGCDNFCSYCIIPYLRGRSRSRDIEEIYREIQSLSQRNAEIVLTGINLTLYGKDKGASFADLIRRIKDIDVRIRLGSFHAEGLTEELLDALFQLKQFCPHFHLSLQSGDNDVLRSMNRRYTAEEYMDKIKLIRSYDANAAITTDLIIGYPTETQKMFENTVEFVKKAKFADIHVFPYSAREGTAAAKLKLLPKDIVSGRVAVVLELKKDLQKNYLNANIGITQKVLFEEESKGIKSGYSERYIRVYAKSDAQTAEVLPKEIYKDGLMGEVII